MQLDNQTLLQFNKVNANNRIYIKDEFTRTRTKGSSNSNAEHIEYTLLEKLNGSVLYGQIDFPDNFNISLTHASHVIRNIRIEGDLLLGDITILDTWKGTELTAIIESIPDSIVFRPRSTGTVNERRQVVNLNVITFDAINKSEDSF